MVGAAIRLRGEGRWCRELGGYTEEHKGAGNNSNIKETLKLETT